MRIVITACSSYLECGIFLYISGFPSKPLPIGDLSVLLKWTSYSEIGFETEYFTNCLKAHDQNLINDTYHSYAFNIIPVGYEAYLYYVTANCATQVDVMKRVHLSTLLVPYVHDILLNKLYHNTSI